MIDYAFTHEEVRAVAAHTLAETNASNSVLRKVGMTFVAEADHPEVGKTWRWRISRDEYLIPIRFIDGIMKPCHT